MLTQTHREATWCEDRGRAGSDAATAKKRLGCGASAGAVPVLAP